MNTNQQIIREEIRKGLETARATFHTLLESLTEGDFKKQSHNPGWTNGEILAHMTFGFMLYSNAISNPGTRPSTCAMASIPSSHAIK